MRTHIDCLPCFTRQAVRVARVVTEDRQKKEALVKTLLGELSRMDLSQPPPVLAQRFYRLARPLMNGKDPYANVKETFTRLALEMLPELERRVRSAGDPFATAVRLAIAGNIIDAGMDRALTLELAKKAVQNALNAELVGDPEEFRRAIVGARQILYLGDNAGEVVFDRLLLNFFPLKRTAFVVRGQPILNDATLEDARAAGLPALLKVVENGSDVPGTVLADCSPSFRKLFQAADLIVSKGQGNFETLSSSADERMFFLFTVKCSVVADEIGAQLGELVLFRGERRSG
jgi:uncharacterized protein with ATP-grasp and redox domains